LERKRGPDSILIIGFSYIHIVRRLKTILLIAILKPLPSFCQTDHDFISEITKEVRIFSNNNTGFIDKNNLDRIVESKYESFKAKKNFVADALSDKSNGFLPIKNTFLPSGLGFSVDPNQNAPAKISYKDELNPNNLLINTIEANTVFRALQTDKKAYLSYSHKLDSISKLGIAINEQITNLFSIGTIIKKLNSISSDTKESNIYYFSYSNGSFKDTIYLNNWHFKDISLDNVEELYVAKKTVVNTEFNYEADIYNSFFELIPVCFKLKNGDTYLIDEKIQKFEYDVKYNDAINDPLREISVNNETESSSCTTYNEFLFNPEVKFISSECQTKKSVSSLINWVSESNNVLPNIKLVNCNGNQQVEIIFGEIMHLVDDCLTHHPFNADPYNEGFDPNNSSIVYKSSDKKSSILNTGRIEKVIYSVTLNSAPFSSEPGTFGITISMKIVDIGTKGDIAQSTPYREMPGERNQYSDKLTEYKTKIIEKLCQRYNNRCSKQGETFVILKF